MGPGPEFLKLCFKSPADFGYDSALVGSEQCQSLVCAIGEGNCAAAMTHKWYPYKDGVMFCSRFWIGYALIDGVYKKILPEGVRLPEIVPQGLFAHNIKEFSTLAAILPRLWAECPDCLGFGSIQKKDRQRLYCRSFSVCIGREGLLRAPAAFPAGRSRCQ